LAAPAWQASKIALTKRSKNPAGSQAWLVTSVARRIGQRPKCLCCAVDRRGSYAQELLQLQRVNPGFQPDHLLTPVALRRQIYDATADRSLLQQLLSD